MDNSDLAGIVFAGAAISGVIAGAMALVGMILAVILIRFL